MLLFVNIPKACAKNKYQLETETKTTSSMFLKTSKHCASNTRRNFGVMELS